MKLALVLFGLACLVAEPAHAEERSVRVQAICMDARGMPHPAAQTFAGRDVAVSYVGELLRCLPGTALRYTADSLNHHCAAGDALWYEDGRLSCRAEVELEAERERDLLRQFGPGEKIVQIASDARSEPPPDGPRIVNGYARTQ